MAVIEGIQFLTQGLRNGVTVGAVWPSSKGLCRAMVAPVFEGTKGPLRVLEVGAGVGPVTSELVERLLPGDTLDVVELNDRFCAILEKRFSGAPLPPRVHNESILDFAPSYRFHHIISGLPLANFPAEMVEAIYAKFFRLLELGGTLIMFQHILAREVISTLGGPKNRSRARALMAIERELAPLVVGERTVMLNMPPARVVVRRRPLLLEDGSRKKAS